MGQNAKTRIEHMLSGLPPDSRHTVPPLPTRAISGCEQSQQAGPSTRSPRRRARAVWAVRLDREPWLF
jgi:hypothetical protein